jgi:type I restriction enzyme S subunit
MTEFKLKDLLEIKNGRDYKHLSVGQIPVYGSGGLMRYVDESLYQGESILLPRKGTLSNIQYVNESFWTVDTLYYSIVDKSKAEPYYLYRYLTLLDLNHLNSGTGVPSMTFGAYYDIPIKLPNLSTQKQSAKVLSDLDAKIEVNNNINQELEAMAKTLYDYWFVQFDFPDVNGKPYKSSGGKLIFNKELKREIPDGWEVKFLTEEMDLQYGFPFSTKLFNDEEKGVPVIRIRDILNGTISNYSTQKVDEKYKLNKGDIIVGMDGNFHINYWNKQDCYLNQRSLRIRSNEDSVSEIQARYSIEPYIKAREKNVSRTTVAHLSAKDVNDLKVLKATNEVQIKANSFFKSTLDKIVSNREQNQKFSAIRDWLLPMLMNGQVTVGEVEQELGMVAEDNAKYVKG